MRDLPMNVTLPPGLGVKDTKYYDVLGLPPNAEIGDIRKAFRLLARKFHPDKNPNDHEAVAEKFKELAYIFSVLEDPNKRSVYDRYGEEAVKDGGMRPGSPDGASEVYASKMFEKFFGNNDLFSDPPPEIPTEIPLPQGRDVTHKVFVSLEDLYVGKTSRLMVSKKVICKACRGVGGKEGRVFVCHQCRGRGVVERGQQIRPGIKQMMSLRCDTCVGEGFVVDETDRCKVCNAEKVITEKKVLDVRIEPGMHPGHRVVLPREADQQPGIIPGDIVIVLEQKPHNRFVRNGNDLLATITIELSEALCGFRQVLQHLDGRPLLVMAHPGEVMREGYVWCAEEQGMPVFGCKGEYGRLLVTFRVNIPSDGFTSPENLALLARLLPPPRPLPPIADSCEPVVLQCVGPMPTQRYPPPPPPPFPPRRRSTATTTTRRPRNKYNLLKHKAAADICAVSPSLSSVYQAALGL